MKHSEIRKRTVQRHKSEEAFINNSQELSGLHHSVMEEVWNKESIIIPS